MRLKPDKDVRQDSRGEWEFRCPVGRSFFARLVSSDLPCNFRSYGWPSRADAEARWFQHLREHETGRAMPERLGGAL